MVDVPETLPSQAGEKTPETGARLAEYAAEARRFVAQAATAGKAGGRKAAPDSVFAHWYTLIEGLQESPMRFYQSVELALQERQIPGTENSRIEYREGGVLSAKREYLHVERGNLVFDICGAPFGTGFFVSWWLAEAQFSLNPLLKVLAVLALLGLIGGILDQLGFFWGLVSLFAVVPAALWLARKLAGEGKFDDRWIQAIPGIGWLYTWLFKPATYYAIDTRLIFQTAVHQAVLDVVDGLTKAKGLRALAESERKPIMRDFFGRRPV